MTFIFDVCNNNFSSDSNLLRLIDMSDMFARCAKKTMATAAVHHSLSTKILSFLFIIRRLKLLCRMVKVTLAEIFAGFHCSVRKQTW